MPGKSSPEVNFQPRGQVLPQLKQHAYISIDMLRAMAALGVLFYHQHIGSLLNRYTKTGIFSFIEVFGATYAVPLFFLISGYCIHLSNIKYLLNSQKLPLKKYYARRFLRIYPPYLAALIIAVIINRVTQIEAAPSTGDLVIHLFALQGFVASSFNTINVVLWTISIEIAFYLIYPVFYYWRSKYSLNRALIFIFAISFVSIGLIIALTHGNYNLPQKYFVLNLWFAWCCGAFLADKKSLAPADLHKPVYKVVYAIIAAIFISSFYFYDQTTAIIYYQFYILIWTAPMMLLISREYWFKKHNKDVKLLAAIGLSSYSLYLLHEPLIYLKNYLAHRYLTEKYQFAAMLIGLLCIPAIAWLNYRMVEKPFMGTKKITPAVISE